MGYLNCPSCARRLRVPDSLSPMELQCPACKHTFRSDGVDLDEHAAAHAPAGARAVSSGERGPYLSSPPSAGPQPPHADAYDSPASAAGRILSQADEALLRDYGSGSGLLELTREAMSLSAREAAEPPARDEERGGAHDEPPPSFAAPASREELDRQFQIIGTALTLANKLVLAHKTELVRSRRIATLSWALAGALALSAIAAGWWAMRQSGQGDLDRQNATNLSGRLKDSTDQVADFRAREAKQTAEMTDLRTREAKQAEELSAARSALNKAESALAAARETLAGQKGAADALAAELKSANDHIATLTADVRRLEAAQATVKFEPIPAATSRPAPSPAAVPSPSPSPTPGATPSSSPSPAPSVLPAASPSASPSASPRVSPSASPSPAPSVSPIAAPSASPSAVPPTASPAPSPATKPSAASSASPSPSPAASRSVWPVPVLPRSAMPAASPSAASLASPVASATPAGTSAATAAPVAPFPQPTNHE